jgi:calcineurin-like phosphoesterase family protein
VGDGRIGGRKRMKVIVDEDLNDVLVTADHHFGHENIIKFCNRPFPDVGEMDKRLIDNWNKIVSPQNWVIHLADFTLGGIREAREYFSQLNGDICVLEYCWHHDRNWLTSKRGFKSKSGFAIRLWPPMVVLEIPQLSKNGYPLAITLCHYPLAVWDRKHYGSWALVAHTHKPDHSGDYILNVGVDCTDFYPISLARILEKMCELGWSL